MITVNNKKICENCFRDVNSDTCPHCGFNRAGYRTDPVALPIGSLLSQRYLIGGVIGKGGFGITYLAYDTRLDTRIAVKEYYPMGVAIRTPGSATVSVTTNTFEESFNSGAEKFYNEAKMVAKFNGNPNIVSVYDFFYENDTVYFTMGYLEGQSLKSYIQDKKISEGQAVRIMQDVSNALMASHSLNILHRDVSPDNIMLCTDGSIRLLDFGAARQVMAEQSQSFSVILKQGYAPIEQYQKKGKQGPWTDIYALGATVYHCLTGANLDDPMSRIEDDSDYESNSYGISEKLWQIIKKSTALKVSARYQDIFELKKDLNELEIVPEPFDDIRDEKEQFMDFNTSEKAAPDNVQRQNAADSNATVYLSETKGNTSGYTADYSSKSTGSGNSDSSQNTAGNVYPRHFGKKHKKKIIPIVIATALGILILTGIVILVNHLGSDETVSGDNSDVLEDDNINESSVLISDAEDESSEKQMDDNAQLGDTGTVLNICWLYDTFINMLDEYYPGYEAIDASHGKIGDVDVVWTAYSSGSYMLDLYSDLSAGKDIDIFLVDGDYAKEYAESNLTMTFSELGINSADLADQYKYTKDLMTDSNGELKGASWNACPGGMIYNREIARRVLGSDDPETVQKAVDSWDRFILTSDKMTAAGYRMCSVYDTYKVYSENVSSRWVEGGRIRIDDNIIRWVEDSERLVKSGAATTDQQWSKEWMNGMNSGGNIFCYFGPSWFFNYSMNNYDSNSIASNGGWGLCAGPQSFYWGGTYVCVSENTDNASLVKDIILTLTANPEVLKKIAIDNSESVNSKTVMSELSANKEFNTEALGGQNPYGLLSKSASGVNMSYATGYDLMLEIIFKESMGKYFTGEMTMNEALNDFYGKAEENFPELHH